MSGYQFVLALIAVVGLILVATVAAVGQLVCRLVGVLDHLVNGWPGGGHDDDGDDPPDGPAPDDPSSLQARPPRPGLLAGLLARTPPALAASRNAAAARLAANLRTLAGTSERELLDRYADPVPGHPTTCMCHRCVYRLTERYAAATAEDVTARLRIPGPGAGSDGEAGA